jgi:hypothetical protein
MEKELIKARSNVKLIKEGAFSVVVTPAHLYYICKDKHNQHDRFYKTNLVDTVEVSQEEFAEAKFGSAWKSIHSHYTECIKLANGEYLTCHFESSIVYRLNEEGKKIHQYDIAPLKTGFDSIYSITLDKLGYLWIAEPSSHYIGQYDIDGERELFSIGGDYENPDILNYPEQVRAFGDYLYISDMANHRLCRLHIETKELSEYIKFQEPVWEYVQFQDKELIKLQSGLYIIKG